MPVIRRPSWRPRKFSGHEVESLMTKRNLDLETDPQWQIANLVEATRALLIQRTLTAWFLRLPGQRQTFATLVEFAGSRGRAEGDRAFRQATPSRGIPLTTDADTDMICTGRRHLSVVDGRVRLYLNGTHDIWRDVGDYLHWRDMPPEDRAAFQNL